jgi:transglutaminase-like putative cysteine protease
LLIFVTVTWANVGDILKVIETPGPCPKGLAFDGKNLWLVDAFTDKIYAIEPETGNVIRSFETPGYEPEGLAWDGECLWHTDSAENLLYRLNPQSGQASKVIESSTSNPRDIGWDGTFLWIIDHKKDVLMRVSPVDGSAVRFFDSPAGEPTGLTFDGKYLWVTDRIEDRIYLIDPEDGICLSSLRSYGPLPYGLAWGDKFLWNVDYENRQIYKVKVFDKNILSRWEKRQMALHFIKEFRNYGPGTVNTLNVYLPLPENRDNQTLLDSIEFDSEPVEIFEDDWGQKIAHFSYNNIDSYGLVRAGWKVKANIYAAEYFIYPDKVGTIDKIPREIKDQYLQDAEKYLIHDPFIKKLARQIVGKEKNPYWIARRVMDYLGKNLSYNLKPIGGWNPAPVVLKRGTASCSEYSYCMIALCRASGVPIRYVGAVSRRGDDGWVDDVFHRWVEVYLPPYGWIPFDANKGDKPRPGDKVLGVGNVSARYIITTENGGGDKYLWFGYNYGYNWTSEGKCRVHDQNYGLWSNFGEKKYNKPENP